MAGRLPTEPLEWITFLSRLHDRELHGTPDAPGLLQLDALYRGTAKLNYLHPEVVAEVGDRIKPIMLGWPMLAIDPLEERLDVLGFRYPDDDIDGDETADAEEVAAAAGDANLQRVWDDNDLDTESSMGHIDSLLMKRAYVQVGTRPKKEHDTDSPLVTVESPLEMFGYVNPQTRMLDAVLRRWTEIDPLDGTTMWRYGTLSLPDARYHFQWGGAGPTPGWREMDGTRDAHGMGHTGIEALTNRARLSDRYGSSELTPQLLSLSHDADVLASLMMVGAEFHAIPLRALFNIGPDDLIDEAGNKMTALQVILGRLLTLPAVDGAPDIKAHEFTASSLANFHDSMNQLARHAAGLIGVPPDALGLTTDQPPSAESRRAGEIRQIKRAERKQRAFNAWARSMRVVRRIQEGDWDPRARRLATIWRDAGTPTRAQAADAAVKMLTAGISTKRQAREDVSYTPSQIRRMEAEDAVEGEREARAVEQVADRLARRGTPDAEQAEPVTAGEPV